MPARIIRDANNRPVVVYTPDPYDRRSERPERPRPQGRYYRDPETGRLIVRQRSEPRYYVGLDLGQANDWTALAVLERNENGYAVCFLDRVRSVPYPRIVSRVVRLFDEPPLSEGAQLVLDATGVGRPVLDMLQSSGLAPIAVTITGGQHVTGSRLRPRVPKRDLINAVLLSLQVGALRVASELQHAATLRRELSEMRLHITAGGHDQYGGAGAHDDVVVALAMAVWAAEKQFGRVHQSIRLAKRGQ